MALQSWLPVLKDAREQGYGVGLFDCHTVEGAVAIVEAAVEERSPVILAPLGPTRVQQGAFIRALAEDADVPISIHLDHGRDFDIVMQCIRGGYTDVMLDASVETYDVNVAGTKQVVAAARPVGVGVEAELGHVGQGANYDDEASRKALFTQADDAERFVDETGCDILAVAIGSAHGVYKGKPELDFERLEEISTRIPHPLVLHGGSGIPPEAFQKAVSLGISKINIYTGMAQAAVGAMRTAVADDDASYMGVQRQVQAAIKDVVVEHMQIFGSSGKADRFRASGSGLDAPDLRSKPGEAEE